MSSKFFITTPVYYSNGIPHIGHTYSSLIADTLANYHLLRGDEVKFLTGVDENSQKVVESATERGMEIMEYADMMALEHQKIWDGLAIHYTTFVRTATPVHHAFVQEMLQRSYDAGDIYEGLYEGLYCVGCEGFKKESDLIAGKCPDHPNKPLEHLKEKNYFFRLSRYQDRLLEFYESHPEFITPSNRYAEILEFVRGGLEDFSVSRETNKFGIPLPFDPSQVTYVWYDALFNYLTYCQEDEKKWWPADIHVIGKDIARFHGIYWPAMLWSAGYDTPSQLLVTGHFTVNGQKMSKTIGNVIDPVAWCEKYSRDALLLYLFTAFPIGQDGDFDEHEAILQYNAKLANNIGNLLNRIIALSLKVGGTISGTVGKVGIQEIDTYKSSLDNSILKDALESIFAIADDMNRYVDSNTPWKKDIMIDSEKGELESILFHTLTGIRIIALMMLPFFPEKSREILTRIGTPYMSGSDYFGELDRAVDTYMITEKGDPLYTRLELLP